MRVTGPTAVSLEVDLIFIVSNIGNFFEIVHNQSDILKSRKCVQLHCSGELKSRFPKNHRW